MVPGIASLSKSTFITSALDGTVQTFSLEPEAVSRGQVTPCPVAMETGGGGGGGAKEVRAQGVAVSEMGVFAAVAIRWVQRSILGR